MLEDLASLLPASEQQLALRAALEAEGGRSAIPDTAGKLRSPCTELKSLPTPHTAGKQGRQKDLLISGTKGKQGWTASARLNIRSSCAHGWMHWRMHSGRSRGSRPAGQGAACGMPL